MSPRPEWIETLREGDVLRRGGRNGRGAFRIVRTVSSWGGRVRAVTFAIRHRSWTNRAYTVLFVNDLLQQGYEPIGARVKLTSEFDAKLRRAIEDDHLRPFPLTADDVRGVA